MIEIRPAVPDDLPAIYEICLRTGDAGGDATGSYDDPLLLGHVYAGPYAVHEPSLAYVAEDAQGVAGYVLGASDVIEFGRWLEHDWFPPLRSSYPIDGDYRETDRRLVELIHAPSGPSSFAASHPSELHIDLLPRCQGTGAGRTLIDTLLEALRLAGSPGVHLGVDPDNANAAGFYRHLGFEERLVDGATTFTRSL